MGRNRTASHVAGRNQEASITRHPKRWLIGLSLFALVNLGGLPVAILEGEPMHAVTHAVLFLVATYFAFRLVPRVREQREIDDQLHEPRLDRLQQSLDSIAIEVERIGESQRFMTRIVAERAEGARRRPAEDGSGAPRDGQ